MTTGILVVEVPESVVVIEEDESTVIVEEQVTIIEVTSGGAQGAQGGEGPPGADSVVPGPPGTPGLPGAGFNYIHTQSIPNTIWVINHNLSGYPNVATVDTNSPPEQIEGLVKYVDANTIRVEFSFSIGGQAYLS